MERPPVYVHDTNILVAFYQMPDGALYAYRSDSNGNVLGPGTSKFDLMIHYYNESRGLYLRDQDGNKIIHDYQRLTYQGIPKRSRDISSLHFEVVNDPIVFAFFDFLDESLAFEESGHGARRRRLMELIERGLPLDLLDRMDVGASPPPEDAAASVEHNQEEEEELEWPEPEQAEVEVDQRQEEGRYETDGDSNWDHEKGAGDMTPAEEK